MWRLREISGPGFFGVEPTWLPTTEISDEAVLRKALESYRCGRPQILTLEAPDGAALVIGLGDNLGAVDWNSADYEERLTAWSPSPPVNKPVEFCTDSAAEVFFPGNILTATEVIEIAVHFYKTGQLADWVKWGPRDWDYDYYVIE
jgi:hypothetical protein